MAQYESEEGLAALLQTLPEDQRQRALDRWHVAELRARPSAWSRLLLFATLIGPGILVMLGDNDAGGVITYAQTGATYGLGFFIPFLLLMIPVAYVVQEMTVRLGAVTHRGHAEMIWGRYGAFWGAFSLIDLVVANVLTLVTEFIGIRTSMAVFHVPPAVSVIGGWVFVSGTLMLLRYTSWERLAFWIAILNVIFVPLAILSHPDWSAVASAVATWHIPAEAALGPFIYVVLANLGTTIAPWMVFFQQSSVVDKGLTVRDIRHGQIDTAIGSIVMGIVAIAIVVLTATLLHHRGAAPNFDIDQILHQIGASPLGAAGMKVFALGLLEASLVAAIAITASTSWAVGEALRLPRSLNLPPRQALSFYLSGLVSAGIAAVIVLIPNAPLGILNLSVQVVASIFMPAAMLFLLLLLNDHEIMGVHVNRPWQNIAAVSIIGLLVIANGVYGYTIVTHQS